ncbi:MAG: PHB depolymerase family esterase [Pseudomonadota bacterium]
MIARTLSIVVLCYAFMTPTAAMENGESAPTGRYQIERTIADILDEETLDLVGEMATLDDKVTWSVHVPDTYDPRKPAGLLVYVSPTNRGWMPRGWSDVVDEENLIWIAANGAGNKVPVARRVILAAVAPSLIAESHTLNPNRVYLAGFSGGGKVSGMIAPDFPNLFRGAIYIGGAAFWAHDEHPCLQNIRRNRYVFIAGSADFNLGLTKRIYHRYLGAGVENSKLMVIRGMDHDTPNATDIRRAIRYLDTLDSN